MPTMKRPYQLTALVLFALSCAIAYEALQLQYYTRLGPGPGFFPFWLSLCLAALSVTMFFHATFKTADPRPGDFVSTRIGYLRAGCMCIAWIWAALMLERLGYRLTMLVFFPFLLRTLGRVRWPMVAAVTLIGSIVTFYVFTIKLGAPLPIGPLDETIFGYLDDLLF
jgi:putative tricarboxylic transport membrane protein